MAKNNKQPEQKTTAQLAVTTMTVDNVMDSLRKGNLMQMTLTKQVQEDIQKEKDERKAEALKLRVLKASYRRIQKLLQLRARRRENEITLDTLKKSELLEDSLSGFVLTPDKIKKHGGEGTKLELEVIINSEGAKEKRVFELKEGEEVWVPGSITVAEYDDKESELTAEERKRMRESDEQLTKELKELRAQYPGYFSYSWDW